MPAEAARVTAPPPESRGTSWWSRLSLRWRLILIATVPQLLYTNTMTWLGNHTVREAHARLSVEFAAYPDAVRALHEIWNGSEITSLVFISLGLGLLAALGAAQFARTIQARVEHLRLAANRIASGDLSTPVGLVGTSEIGRLGETLEEVRGTLEKRIELEVQAAVLEKDLALARTVEQLFLPRKDEFETAQLATAGFHRAALRVSGDLWSVHEDEDQSLWILLGDVAGNGPGPAMVGGAVMTSFRVLVKRGGLSSPEQLLRNMHASLMVTAAHRHTVALSLVHVTKDGLLTFHSAGSQPLFLRRASGSVESIPAGGSALGQGKPAFAKRELKLSAGDLVLAYTNGLLDAKCRSGSGVASLRDRLSALSDRSARGARDQLGAELASIDKRMLTDDITFVMISRREPSG